MAEEKALTVTMSRAELVAIVDKVTSTDTDGAMEATYKAAVYLLEKFIAEVAKAQIETPSEEIRIGVDAALLAVTDEGKAWADALKKMTRSKKALRVKTQTPVAQQRTQKVRGRKIGIVTRQKALPPAKPIDAATDRRTP